MKKIIVTGAGFSIDAGVPPQTDLLKEVIAINLKTIDYEDINLISHKKIVAFFLKLLFGNDFETKISKNEILLEDIYTILDLNILKQKNLHIFNIKHLYRIREALNECISYVVKVKDKNKLIKYQRKILKEIDNNEVTFISTNWDSWLETVLESLNYKIDYAIDMDVLSFPGKAKTKSITVLKPHGSLNWKTCPICETVFTIDSDKYSCTKCQTIYANVHKTFPVEITELKTLLEIPQKSELCPIIVSPTFLKTNFMPQINMIFQKMYHELSEVKEVIFIGYSLPISDHDIREVLIKANARNSEIQTKVILKPSKREDKKRLKNNFETIYKKSKTKYKWTGF